MRRIVLIAMMIIVVGCGDVKSMSRPDSRGIDAADEMDGSITDASPDAPPQFLSCSGLPSTCGGASTDNCCATGLPITGGTFYRSYDVATDSSYKDMSAPASVSPFRLDKYEVTVGRFRKFINAGYGTQAKPPFPGAGAHPNNPGSGWDSTWNQYLTADTSSLVGAVKCNPTSQTWTDAAGTNENLPMNCLTWYEAMAFCIWDGGYLPTEGEWNFAAAGGLEQRAYPWSNPAGSVSLDCTYANYFPGGAPTQTCGSGASAMNRVGSESPKGDGRWGQSDLAGNVVEWTLDSYAPYVTPCTDCAILIGGNRVARGGSTGVDVSVLRAYLRVAERLGGASPTGRDFKFGVRCARAP